MVDMKENTHVNWETKLAKDNVVAVTIPSYLMPKFNKVLESLNMSRQEVFLHLLSEYSPSDPVELPRFIKGPNGPTTEALDWNATDPWYFGPSNYGFQCRYHGKKHPANTELVFAGPEDEDGNRRKICAEAAEELKLNI